MLLPQLILTLGESHSLDLVACHSNQWHSYFVSLDFTFKHFVIYLLQISGWDDYLCVSSLLTGTFFSFFFQTDLWYHHGRLPSLARKFRSQDTLTKSNTPPSNPPQNPPQTQTKNNNNNNQKNNLKKKKP